jgi:Holliday junction resolvase
MEKKSNKKKGKSNNADSNQNYYDIIEKMKTNISDESNDFYKVLENINNSIEFLKNEVKKISEHIEKSNKESLTTKCDECGSTHTYYLLTEGRLICRRCGARNLVEGKGFGKKVINKFQELGFKVIKNPLHKEVDFILDTGKERIAVEVKYVRNQSFFMMKEEYEKIRKNLNVDLLIFLAVGQSAKKFKIFADNHFKDTKVVVLLFENIENILNVESFYKELIQ